MSLPNTVSLRIQYTNVSVELEGRLGLPLKKYLLAVLPGLDARKISEIPQLTASR